MTRLIRNRPLYLGYDKNCGWCKDNVAHTQEDHDRALSSARVAEGICLTDYVNAADIGGADAPHVVVEKLQAAIDKAAPESPAKEQPGEQNIVNWTTEGCPKHHGLSWTMGATLAYTQIAKRCPLCEPPPPERP